MTDPVRLKPKWFARATMSKAQNEKNNESDEILNETIANITRVQEYDGKPRLAKALMVNKRVLEFKSQT